MAEFFKLEIANWNVGTDDLTLEQEAAYLRIVGMIRLYEQPLKHNLRVLSGLWRCNERKAKRLLSELVLAGKLSVNSGLIVNEKAVEDASNLRQSRVDKQSAGRAGGIESGKSRRNALKDNDVSEAPALTREEKTRLDENRGEGRISEDIPPPPPELGGGGFSVDDFDKLLAAVGYDPAGHIPAPWFPDSPVIVAWLERLTSTQIIAAAKASREVHADAPATPQALNTFMDQAAAKPAATPRPTDAQIMAAQASRINGPGFCAANLVTPSQARALIDAGLVTSGKLSERGIAA